MKARFDEEGNQLLRGMYFKAGTYYLVRNNKWVRLGKKYVTSCERYGEITDDGIKPTDPEWTKHHTQIDTALEKTLKFNRHNAAARGLEHEISYEYALSLLVVQDYKCAVTGTPFDTEREEYSNKMPLAASLDRIDNSKGYLKGNVRLVCVAANYAMNQWGEKALHDMFRHWKAREEAT